jgi:hypothetical protein
MNEDESAKIRRLRRAVVHRTSTAAIAVLVSAILVDHARGGELMDCEPQPVHGDRRHWAYRIIDGRECWYPGERGKPKDELRWAEAASAPQQSRELEQSGVEAGPPEPAPQQSGVVEQSEVSPKPSLDLSAASPELDTINAMPEEWRSAAADQLLAFTCCWPELPEAVPLPQPGLGQRQDQPPAWPLILLPLALCAMWSTSKLASKKLRRPLAPDFCRPAVPPWWRSWEVAVRRRAHYVLGPKAQQKGPAGGIAGSSANAHRPTKLARIDGALVPLAPHGLPTAPRDRRIPPASNEGRSTLTDRSEVATDPLFPGARRVFVPTREKSRSRAL